MRIRRSWRSTVTGTIGLFGLALLTLSPATVVLGWHELNQRKVRAEAERHHLGVTVRDGPVAFVVHDVTCGEDKLGRRRALGHFCLVTLSARNEGEKPLEVQEAAQRAHGATGARYIPDRRATKRANPEGNPFGTLEPGEDLTGVVAFDVPPAIGITHVEVHAGVYTHGVPVAVTLR